MKWFEMRVETTEEAYDAVTEMLTSLGAGGVAIEDPNDILREIEKPDSLDYADEEFLTNLGDSVIIKAYFHGDSKVTELIDLINEKLEFISQFLSVGKGYIGYSEVDDEDWATSWKKYYKPFELSERVVIKPSWEEYKNTDGKIVIELDPGMAFGTGTHETTKMCAQLLEEFLKGDETVIDVGCGTGILAIIAVKLGARHVTAIDIDDVAVRVTNENCELNNVNSTNITAFKGILSDVQEEKHDVIVANIIANVIIDISKSIPLYLKANGLLITSGIIKERKNEVIDTYTSQGFICEKIIELGEWVAIVFRCQNSL